MAHHRQLPKFPTIPTPRPSQRVSQGHATQSKPRTPTLPMLPQSAPPASVSSYSSLSPGSLFPPSNQRAMDGTVVDKTRKAHGHRDLNRSSGCPSTRNDPGWRTNNEQALPRLGANQHFVFSNGLPSERSTTVHLGVSDRVVERKVEESLRARTKIGPTDYIAAQRAHFYAKLQTYDEPTETRFGYALLGVPEATSDQVIAKRTEIRNLRQSLKAFVAAFTERMLAAMQELDRRENHMKKYRDELQRLEQDRNDAQRDLAYEKKLACTYAEYRKFLTTVQVSPAAKDAEEEVNGALIDKYFQLFRISLQGDLFNNMITDSYHAEVIARHDEMTADGANRASTLNERLQYLQRAIENEKRLLEKAQDMIRLTEGKA